MRRELPGLQTDHLRALFQDRVDRLRIERPRDTVPHHPIALKALPLSIFAAASQAFNASTGRPVR